MLCLHAMQQPTPAHPPFYNLNSVFSHMHVMNHVIHMHVMNHVMHWT